MRAVPGTVTDRRALAAAERELEIRQLVEQGYSREQAERIAAALR